MALPSIQARISKDLFLRRKQDKEILAKALNGLKISDVDIDRLYVKKLMTFNIIDEFPLFREKKKTGEK